MYEVKTADDAGKFELKVEDYINLGTFYKNIFFYIKERGWVDPDVGDTQYETYYSEKDEDGAQAHKIIWKMKKADPINSNFVDFMKIVITTLNMRDEVLMIDNQKVKAKKGEVKIVVSTNFEFMMGDKKEIEKSFFAYFYKLLPSRLYRKQLEDHKDQLFKETMELQAMMKTWLQLKASMSGPDTMFHPSQAYPQNQV